MQTQVGPTLEGSPYSRKQMQRRNLPNVMCAQEHLWKTGSFGDVQNTDAVQKQQLRGEGSPQHSP